MVTTKLEAGDALPPAYTQTDATPPPSRSQDALATPAPLPSSSAPPALATNFLNISRTNNSIKGAYTINPAMQMPPSVVPPVDANGHNLNMRLASENGPIDVAVDIIGHSPKGPTRIEAGSKNGSVTLTVRDKSHHPFVVLASSHNGAITLRIPPHFTGPVSTRLGNGRLTVSPSIKARLTTFSEDGHDGRFFVGNFAQEGFEDDAAWQGSAVRVEAHNGRVRILAVDEEEPKGFFGKLFS